MFRQLTAKFSVTPATGAVLCPVLILLLQIGCGQKDPPESRPAQQRITVKPEKAIPLVPKKGSTLYITQAQFTYQPDEQGRMLPVPGAARLMIYTFDGTQWNMDLLEDPDSNVFHKAEWFDPPVGDPGILTIGADRAYLKLWRFEQGRWTGHTLWSTTFGGRHDRLRDFEVADVTGNGSEDIVIATHDQGVVAVVTWIDDYWKSIELCRTPDTFVHEIETGDVDGDGLVEIFSTPSKPNKLDGSIQPGSIEMWKYVNNRWISTPVDILETRHAKEILCTRLHGEDNPVLLTALEGKFLGGQPDVLPDRGDSTVIRLYRFDGAIEKKDIAVLPGQLCRFLTTGDTDGNGLTEVIASTKSTGIWKLTPPSSPEQTQWRQNLIASGTSGFEHSTFLIDLDGDQKDEIIVASDDQKELRRYWFDGIRYSMERIDTLKEDTITFNITARIAEPKSTGS
ncbi:hypothetical protein JXA40_12615 [bacterium]|nr:hypothetical protein [candidate division CSSED10-310 bacterium]